MWKIYQQSLFYQDMLIHIGLPNSSNLLHIMAVYFKNCKEKNTNTTTTLTIVVKNHFNMFYVVVTRKSSRQRQCSR